ncbi:MAG: hypothetical protein IK990_03180 [Ruminiclostridium sp.]|nr:hypothetical protein [Ruminiclostridium sp.]
MDRFSEQLVTKQSTGKDMFLRGLLVAAGILLVGAIIFFLTGLGAMMVAIVLSAAVIWGLVWLLQGTFTEYEYIVTNDDLDIDKITGKRKRKRLITLSLREAKQLEEYKPDTEIKADVTVMAHDETGVDLYCFVCGSKEYGDIAVVFNPDKRTLYNMIGGFSPAVRNKYAELYEKIAPKDTETENDDDDAESAEVTETVNDTPADTGTEE